MGLWAIETFSPPYLLLSPQGVVNAMNEDFSPIEPEWRSALGVAAVIFGGISLIIAGFWL
ncbi:hypothetical protein [Rhizobium rhizogenes]|uniref:hypothetical protein n=1 Tax=Rhizobium rhizogenes TaxID=359 RepID=UPI0024BEB736|nr:hypothetical protein [Rhizobium rhizogenes]MDJ1632236.1 hypothetical protein [Rhizobium rhizogenes]